MMMRLSMFQQALVASSRVFQLLDEREEEPKQYERPLVIEKERWNFVMYRLVTMENATC